MAATQGVEVTRLDAAEDMLKITQRRVPKGNFLCGELENLRFWIIYLMW